MKKLLFLLLFIPLGSFGQFGNNDSPITPNELISINSENQYPKEITFRKMEWGETPKDLKRKYPDIEFENSMIDKEWEVYLHEDIVGGIEVNVLYWFFSNKLKIAGYRFSPNAFKGAKDYIKDFNRISDIINKKYNLVRKDKWYDDYYKDKPESWDTSLTIGDVRFDERNKEDTIIHRLSNDDTGYDHSLAYYSPDADRIFDDENDEDF